MLYYSRDKNTSHVPYVVGGRGEKSLHCNRESEIRLRKEKETSKGENNRCDERTSAWLLSAAVPHLAFLVDRCGIRMPLWALPVANCVPRTVVRVSLEGSGSGEIKSGWDQSGNREANMSFCLICMWPINHSEMTVCDP